MSLLQKLRNSALSKSLGESISSYYEFGNYESMERVCVCVCVGDLSSVVFDVIIVVVFGHYELCRISGGRLNPNP